MAQTPSSEVKEQTHTKTAGTASADDNILNIEIPDIEDEQLHIKEEGTKEEEEEYEEDSLHDQHQRHGHHLNGVINEEEKSEEDDDYDDDEVNGQMDPEFKMDTIKTD